MTAWGPKSVVPRIAGVGSVPGLKRPMPLAQPPEVSAILPETMKFQTKY
jgi:hypothetical protein